MWRLPTHRAITVVTGLTTVYCNTPNLHLHSKTLQRKRMIWLKHIWKCWQPWFLAATSDWLWHCPSSYPRPWGCAPTLETGQQTTLEPLTSSQPEQRFLMPLGYHSRHIPSLEEVMMSASMFRACVMVSEVTYSPIGQGGQQHSGGRCFCCSWTSSINTRLGYWFSR